MKDCLIIFRDEVFRIEKAGTQLNTNDPETASLSPVKRKSTTSIAFMDIVVVLHTSALDVWAHQISYFCQSCLANKHVSQSSAIRIYYNIKNYMMFMCIYVDLYLSIL